MLISAILAGIAFGGTYMAADKIQHNIEKKRANAKYDEAFADEQPSCNTPQNGDAVYDDGDKEVVLTPYDSDDEFIESATEVEYSDVFDEIEHSDATPPADEEPAPAPEPEAAVDKKPDQQQAPQKQQQQSSNKKRKR